MLNFIAASAFVCRLSFKRAELTRAVKRKDTSVGDFIRAALEQLPVKPARVGTAQRRRCPNILGIWHSQNTGLASKSPTVGERGSN
jgi:hypothetical protein